jgi:hypothetical protein
LVRVQEGDPGDDAGRPQGDYQSRDPGGDDDQPVDQANDKPDRQGDPDRAWHVRGLTGHDSHQGGVGHADGGGHSQVDAGEEYHKGLAHGNDPERDHLPEDVGQVA